MADEKDRATEPQKPNSEKASGRLTKILATVFAAIIAPLAVGLTMKWLDPERFKKQPEVANQKKEATGNDGALGAKPPSSPQKVVRLRLLRQFKENGHSGRVYTVALGPDTKRLLSGGEDGTIRLWDINGGPPLKVLPPEGKEPAMGSIRCAAFLPDGRRALTAGEGKEGAKARPAYQVRLWDLDAGAVVKRFMGHTDTVGGLALSEDGNTLLTGSDDFTVRLWDIRDDTPVKPLKTLQGHEVGVWSVAMSADGRRAMSGDGGGVVHVWNLTSRDGHPLPPHKFDVLGVAVSHDGKRGATGAVGNFVRLWDLDRDMGQQIGQANLGTGVGAIAFSPDGRWLAVASGWLKAKDGSIVPAVKSGDNRIRLLSVPELKVVAESQDFSEPLNSLTFSRDGKFVSAGGLGVFLFEVKEEAPTTP